MELIDVWCGCLSWHALSDYVQWLPTNAALYRSMAAAQPQKAVAGANQLRLVDPLKAMQHGHTEQLLLQIVNWLEAGFWRESDPKTRGAYKPTLPPGYELAGAPPENNEDVAAYMAVMYPKTEAGGDPGG